eukprot:XP_013995406.1 PREDICTED: quinone oxidoreductase-like [Salmo salar]
MAYLIANATVQRPQVTCVSSTAACQRSAFNVIYKDYSICVQFTTSKLTRAIRVLIHVCGVNQVETNTRKPSLPYTPGSDVSRVVEAVGDGLVTVCSPRPQRPEGMQNTPLCLMTLSPRLPDSLDSKQGAASGIPYFTAYRALFYKAHAKAGKTVLIHGASGGVGVAACQMALGLRVLGTAGTPEGLKLVLRNGAHIECSFHDID